MFLHITNTKYIEEYKVQVSFNNGRNGVADLSSALKGAVFEALKDDPELQSQFKKCGYIA